MKHPSIKVPVKLLIFSLTLCWSVVLGAGFWLLVKYKSTAGENGSVQSQWPKDSRIAQVPQCFNIVVALHPHCPCSRATVTELANILARSKENVHVHALIYRPSSSPEGWEESEIVHSAKKLPGVSIHLDKDSVEGNRFGALTSGHVLLFGANGSLLFNGGITSSRGHQGETPAHEALWSLLKGDSSPLSTTPVYGCPLCKLNCELEPK
ncbi:MAG TPA: hypothetical protein VE988_15950 [Gemmataceae bacterium]|nr:hypothetical protein [Gemmataceae bacterium]